jgi:hypothetical protein
VDLAAWGGPCRREGVGREERRRLQELMRGNRQLRRANEILRNALACAALAELDRPVELLAALMHHSAHGFQYLALRCTYPFTCGPSLCERGPVACRLPSRVNPRPAWGGGGCTGASNLRSGASLGVPSADCQRAGDRGGRGVLLCLWATRTVT